MRGLETELGHALLRRDGRGLVLTEEGQPLAQALREGFGRIAAGVEELRTDERRRSVRVTAAPAFSQSVLMPRLGDFWRRNPDVAVSISPDPEIADLRRDGYDVAVRSGSGAWPGMVFEPLAQGRFLLAGAPDLLKRGPDFARLPWILDPADSRESIWLRAVGLDPERLVVREIDSPTLAVAAATAGYGLIFASDMVVRDEIRAGRLKEVPFRGLPQFTYWVATLPGPRRPPVETFVRWLKAQLAGEGDPG